MFYKPMACFTIKKGRSNTEGMQTQELFMNKRKESNQKLLEKSYLIFLFSNIHVWSENVGSVYCDLS